MPRIRRSYLLSLPAALLATTPVFADVTAQEYWAEWQMLNAIGGNTITADQVTETNQGLEIGTITITNDSDDMFVNMQMDGFSILENADGTVTVVYPSEYNVALNAGFGVLNPDAAFNIEATIRSDMYQYTVSGTPENRVIDASAQNISVEDIKIDSAAFDDLPEFDLTYSAASVTNQTVMNISDMSAFSFSGQSRVEGIQAQFSMVDDAPGSNLNASLSLSSDAVTSVLEIAPGDLMGIMLDPENAPKEGPIDFSFALETTSENTVMDMQVVAGPFSTSGQISEDSSTLRLAVSDQAFGLGLNSTGATISGAANLLPFPIELSYDEISLDFDMPLAENPDPVAVQASMMIDNFVMNDGIWGLFDPAQALQRDPINVNFDGSAMMVNNRDWIILNFVMDGDDPTPVGTIDLALSGGMGAIDQLQALGSIPAQNLAMVRGMIGAFTRPADGPDTVQTTIEFLPDGSITANDVPIE